MGKIIDYPNITALDTSHELLVDGTGGTKNIKATAFSDAVNEISNSQKHRSMLGLRNLGTSITSEQKTNIQNGSLKGFLLGDYWVMGGYNWRIVDINYFKNHGDINTSKPHLVIMPDSQLYSSVMNDTSTTEGGYVGSKIRTSGLDAAKTTVNTLFGNLVLSHREYLINAVSNGAPSGGLWDDCTVELPNEVMYYGSKHFAQTLYGTSFVYAQTNGTSQFALFALCREFMNTRQTLWLRDPVSASHFAGVASSGYADNHNASGSYGVRPYFLLG